MTRRYTIKTSIYTIAAVMAGTLALSAAVNAEGYTSKAGAAAKISASKFQALDTDKSGALNEAELATYNAAINFESADSDKDGRITMSELRLSAKTPPVDSEASVGTSANTTTGTDGTGTPTSETPDASGSGTGGRQ